MTSLCCISSFLFLWCLLVACAMLMCAGRLSAHVLMHGAGNDIPSSTGVRHSLPDTESKGCEGCFSFYMSFPVRAL